MNDAIRKYVVAKVMDDIRGKKVINDQLCITLNEHKSVGELRCLVTLEDIPLLIDIVKTQSATFGNLAIAMMGQHSETDPAINVFLEDLWENGCSKNYERNHTVMLTLLNSETAVNKYRDDFLQFIEDNFAYFTTRTEYYSGGKQHVYSLMSSRLKNKVYPSYKDWIYLCGVLSSDETNLVRTLLTTTIDTTTDAFTKDVATRMLVRTYP